MSHESPFLGAGSEQAVDRRSPISQVSTRHRELRLPKSSEATSTLSRQTVVFWLRAHLQGRAAPEIEVECGSGLKPLQGPSPAGAAY